MNHKNKLLTVLVVSGIALFLQFGLHLALGAQIVITAIGVILTISMFLEMVKTLKSGKYGVDLLAITAVVATLATGEYWAAMIVLIMLTGGDSLEDYAANIASRELTELLKNNPSTAHLKQGSKIIDTSVKDVQVDDVLIVKPGEIVPVDGQILEGFSEFDESSLTGESVLVQKSVNDTVLSGSLNGGNSITIRAIKTASNSQYQTIVNLVKVARAHPAKFVRLADRYAVPFTLIAYVIAGIAWFYSKDPVRFAQVLVVASPCPLILAAPIALVSGMSNANRNGVLIKNGTTIEKFSEAKSIAFDKTGTLTTGNLSVEEVIPVEPFSKKEILQYAASAEQFSNHILARSLVQSVNHSDLLDASNIQEETGLGISAIVNQKTIKVGQKKFINWDTQLDSDIDTTAIYLSINDAPAGIITFKDRIRPESPKVISSLHQQGIRNVWMISGDRQKTVDEIGEQIGIDQKYGDCLPGQKIELIQKISKDKNLRPVVMVGDGVNDAPSLATADVGIALGAEGENAASEAADIVILKNNIAKIPEALAISRNTMKIAKQSVLIGIFICTFLMLIASSGIIPAIYGAMLQEVVDTVSILWALRAHRQLKNTESLQLNQI